MKHCFKIWKVVLALIISLFLTACQSPSSPTLDTADNGQHQTVSIHEDGFYYEVEDVAAYIHLYEDLPDNYITKEEARDMGWSTADDTWVVGGDPFGNYEGLLPDHPGRQYYEADIQAGYTHHRGPERLIFSDDGLIYYTDNHYDSFERLY